MLPSAHACAATESILGARSLPARPPARHSSRVPLSVDAVIGQVVFDSAVSNTTAVCCGASSGRKNTAPGSAGGTAPARFAAGACVCERAQCGHVRGVGKTGSHRRRGAAVPTDVWLSSYSLDPTLPLTGRREPPACWPSGAGRRPREPDSGLPDGTARAEATSASRCSRASPAGHRNVRARSRAEASSTTPMNSSAAARWSCPPPTSNRRQVRSMTADGQPAACSSLPAFVVSSARCSSAAARW